MAIASFRAWGDRNLGPSRLGERLAPGWWSLEPSSHPVFLVAEARWRNAPHSTLGANPEITGNRRSVPTEGSANEADSEASCWKDLQSAESAAPAAEDPSEPPVGVGHELTRVAHQIYFQYGSTPPMVESLGAELGFGNGPSREGTGLVFVASWGRAEGDPTRGRRKQARRTSPRIIQCTRNPARNTKRAALRRPFCVFRYAYQFKFRL